jgi:hypothetical protein
MRPDLSSRQLYQVSTLSAHLNLGCSYRMIDGYPLDLRARLKETADYEQCMRTHDAGSSRYPPRSRHIEQWLTLGTCRSMDTPCGIIVFMELRREERLESQNIAFLIMRSRTVCLL